MLNNIGAILSDRGRREEALSATQEAVYSYRELAKVRPDAFLPDLATALNNLGSDLSSMGQRLGISYVDIITINAKTIRLKWSPTPPLKDPDDQPRTPPIHGR